MRELKGGSEKGRLKVGEVRVFDLMADPENEMEYEEGVNKDEFSRILDKAAQPIKDEAQSDLGQSGT